ncbi:MAG: hypothetical protein KKB46_04240 [Candidatus Omnitrophica bacterium]|nr:hypothetical protein [Candidatus Omnitrophota bacterium]
MRYIRRITNIALIYTLIGVFLGVSYAYALPSKRTVLRLEVGQGDDTLSRFKKLLKVERLLKKLLNPNRNIFDITEPEDTLVIWPVDSFAVVRQLRPLRRRRLQNIILMDYSSSAYMAEKIIFDPEDMLNPETGYLITAEGWQSLDLPLISGKRISRIIKSESFPLKVTSESTIDNKFGNRVAVLLWMKEGEVIAEIPGKITPVFVERGKRYFTKENSMIGIWLVDPRALEKKTELPVITVENCRDFAMTFFTFLERKKMFGQIRYSRFYSQWPCT